MASREDIEQASSAVFSAYRSGKLTVAIDPRKLTLAQATEAHVTIESRATTGKILLRLP